MDMQENLNNNLNEYPHEMSFQNDHDKYNIQILKSIQKDSFRDKVFGCIIGSFIGDACGALAPEQPETLTPNDIDLCLNMVGGGPLNLEPG